MIAQAEAVDRVDGAVDGDRADRAAVLLEVAARELLPGSLRPHAHPGTVTLLARLAPEAGREAVVAELDRDRRVGILGERAARIGEVERPGEHDAASVVADRVLDERLPDLERETRRREAVVPGNLGPGEHERDATVGQVEADGHLRVALVRPVADADEAAQAFAGVVEVVVGALVEVRLAGVRVHQVVGVEQDGAHGQRGNASATPPSTGSVAPVVGVRFEAKKTTALPTWSAVTVARRRFRWR